jgi:hypothetical protein
MCCARTWKRAVQMPGEGAGYGRGVMGRGVTAGDVGRLPECVIMDGVGEENNPPGSATATEEYMNGSSNK